MSERTLSLFREAYYRSEVFGPLTLEAWQEQGCLRAMDVLRRYTRQLLDQACSPQDRGQLMARGEEFIKGLHIAE
jgi:hypothetical protein